MDIPLDEVIHFDAIASDDTGAAVDADSTPTFAVYEESTDTDIGVGGSMTKRTSLTGNYRGSFTASAANGFELGKWYVVIGSATIDSIVCKGVITTFRIIAAEVVAGYPPVDTLKVGGTTQTAGDIIGDTNDIQTRLPASLVSGRIDASVGAMASNVLTAAVAATDFGQEIQALITGGAYALDTDANGRPRIVDGTGVGELDTLSGTVLLRSATQASIDAIEADTNELQTDDVPGLIAALNDLSTSDIDARLAAIRLDELLAADSDIDGAAPPTVGSVFHELMSASTGSFTFDQTTDSLEALAGASAPSAAAIADAVWEEALADHSGTSGSTAEALAAAGSAGDPWVTVLPGAYGAGSAGFILGTNLNATVGSRSSHSAADIWTNGTRNLTALGFTLDSADTDTSLIEEIRDAITGYAGAFDLDANGRVRVVDGTGAGELDTLSGTVLLRSANEQVLADWVNGGRLDLLLDSILGDTNELQTNQGNWLTATGFSTHSAADVWAVATRLLTAGTNIVLAKGVGVTGFNDLSAAQVNAEVDTAIADASLATAASVADLPTNAELATALASADDATLAAIAALNDITAADVWAAGARTLTALGFTLDSADTDSTLIEEIRDAITGYAGALNLDSGGNVKISDGTGANQLSITGGLIDGIAGTIQTLDALDTAQDTQHTTTQSAITALNDVSTAEVLAQIETALATTTRSMPGQVTPGATPTVAEALMQLFQLATNPTSQNASVLTVYNRAGDTAQQQKAASDDGTTALLGALISA